jgi:uncharacterized repeat protein (TIGR02543 family)
MKKLTLIGSIVIALFMTACASPTGSGDSNHTVTFDSDGGSTVASETVASGSVATKPSDPTKSGYAFGGWTLNGSSYDFATKVTADITLKASWTTLATHVVTFDSNGGSAVAPETVTDGSKATKPADPTNGTHNLLGWYNGSAAYDFSGAVTTDLTLTARWSSTVTVEDTVRYDSTNVFGLRTWIGYVTMDMNAKTFSSVVVSLAYNGNPAVTYNQETYAGTFAVNPDGFTFTTTKAVYSVGGISGGTIGDVSTYTVSGSTWTRASDSTTALFGFENGNSTSSPTTATRTVVASHVAEQ